MRKVVVTGAAGGLATRMLPALRERYELVLLDVTQTARKGGVVEDVIVVDLIERDRDCYREYFRGADAVVHCAYRRVDRSDMEKLFSTEMDNITMAYNLYQICLEEGIRRAVVLSSNHAADFYEELIWGGKMEMVTSGMQPLSNNIYGWAKASYEHLGFVFATGGRTHSMHPPRRRRPQPPQRPKLENIQIRIGNVNEHYIERFGAEDLAQMHRYLGAYLSQRDQVQLIVKSIETQEIADEYGVPFHIFYGISGNAHRFWSIANAKKVIGYEPEDDSQLLFAEGIARITTAVQSAVKGSG